ncbi:hypothetical protein [Actinomadura napierensis]|uniref:Uncharacterized protein n=1 Tax=Actinomadura napierensis TaxID=267854 RepID=A0ABN2YKL5_9ACTN
MPEYIAELHGLAPLPSADVLGHAPLYSEDEHYGPGDVRHVRESGVSFGSPLLYPVDDVPRGRGRAVEAVFAFDLDELGGRRRYTAARFRVTLADERAIARRVRPEPPAAPWTGRFRPGAGRVAVRVSGLQTHRFGCAYRDPQGRALDGRSYLVSALLDVPEGLAELAGTLSAEVEIARTVFEFTTHRAAYTFDVQPRFAVPLPGPEGGGAAVRLCLAADVERYRRHGIGAAERTQRRLLAVLDAALREAGVDPSSVPAQEQGDGRFLVFPPGIDETKVVPGLVAGLRAAVRRTNRDLGEQARVRLRAALHRGLVKPAPNGYVGDASIAVHRILGSPPIREALKANPARDLALIVPDLLYRDVIAQDLDGLNPARFERVIAKLEDKGFTEVCWLTVPD